MTNQQLLAGLATALAGGGIRIVDLSQTLRASTPVIQLPPPLAPSQPFRIQEISRYDERGPAWYWNNISCGEHTGTHFDAPAHWITGRDLPDAHTDTHPAPAPDGTRLRDRLLGRGRRRRGLHPGAGARPGLGGGARPDRGRLLGADAHRLVEARGPGCVPQCQGGRTACARGRASPRCGCWSTSAASWGWGVEAVGTDAGQAFAFEPPFPAHNLLHGAGRFGLASLCNLDQLPPKGALLITPPLKIEQGSGSPLRVLALVAG